MRMFGFAALSLTLSLLCCPVTPSHAQTAQRVAFFGFSLINTSLETTTSAEKTRLQALDDLFRQQVDASPVFDIVPIPAKLQGDIGAINDISACNGCERDFALKAGAELAAWGTVQKVSNLILNINVYIEDVASGRMRFVKSVDIRGNTDESWQHGLRYLLRYYLLTGKDLKR
ncbi:MAG TPA: DUF3280 domain-containing protein [Dongiaceae bacterium]|nr:DUF3280 domain-containing protein [Dongiaceae bacterium]